MQDYYKFDERWESFGVSDLKSYEDKFVIKGKFHDLVPKDIRESFITVEYLTAHAYYYWPMYDEALNKSLRILEMAVKLKAKELKVSLKYKDRNGIEKDKTQSRLIDEIWKESHFQTLKSRLDRARKIRNWGMHPERQSYMGGMAGGIFNIKMHLIILNDIFRSEEWFINQQLESDLIDSKLKSFENKLLFLDYQNCKILLNNLLKFQLIGGKFSVVYMPVLINAFESISQQSFKRPIFLQFDKFEITDCEIVGETNYGEKVLITITNNDEDLNKQKLFINDLNKLSQSEMQMYQISYNVKASDYLFDKEYEFLVNQTN